MLTKCKKFKKPVLILNLLMMTFIIFSTWMSTTSLAGEINNLSIRDAVRITLKNNSDLKQKEQTIESSKVSVDREKGNFYPDLVIKSVGSINKGQNLSNGDSNEYQTFDINITSTLNVFNGFHDSASLKKSEIELEAEKKSYSRTNQTVIFNTISNYIEAVSNQKLISAEEENLRENQKQLEQIQAFYDSGKTSATDLYQQQAETKEAELSLLAATNSFKVSTLVLLNTMGLKANNKISLNLPEIVLTDTTFPDYDFNDLLNVAYEKRPDLKSGESLINASNEGIREAKAGYLPSVDLFAEVGSDYNSNYDNGFHDQLADDGVSSTLGFTVSIPLFDRSVTKSNVSEAKITRTKRMLEQESLKQVIELEIGEALEDYRTASKQLEVTESLLKYSGKVLDSMVEKYKTGSVSIVDLIKARSDYAEAQYNNIKSGYNLLKEKVALAYYQGNITEIINNFD